MFKGLKFFVAQSGRIFKPLNFYSRWYVIILRCGILFAPVGWSEGLKRLVAEIPWVIIKSREL